MIRKILTTVLLLLFVFGVQARIPYKIKRDTIPLRETEKSLSLELTDSNISWVSTAMINGKLNQFYGSDERDSMIYLTTSNARFKNLHTDTLCNAKWFQSTTNSCVLPVWDKGEERYPIFIYNYKAPFRSYISDKYLNINNSSKNMSNYFVPNNKIIKIISDGGGTTRAFYMDNRFDKGVVMCMMSNDLGTSWSYPQICISDNIINFKSCSMAIDRTNMVYAIITDTHDRAFLCKSLDYGKTWSYPVCLSHRLYGSNHSITINRSGVYILYHSVNRGETNGDYVVWNGTINDLNNGAHEGQKVVVTESSMVRAHNISDMKIEHLKGNKYLIYGLMDKDGRRIIHSYLFKGRFYL